MSKLKISEELSLPQELAGRTQVILAQKGAGKTYTAMKQTELLLDAGQQVVALDPTGVWWGLRSPAPGRHGKGFGVIVMGGDHGDLPLETTAGAIVADFIAESAESVILDLSAFESNAAQDRFVTDFAERLYRAKASDRRTIHVMLDEADSFCPQRPIGGPGSIAQRMLGAFEAIVRRGRSRGLGITLISQRPAVLNKNVMSQADLLVCLRVVGKHDNDALRDWTNLFATAEQQKEFMETLPKLATGEAWFWSPSWLNIFQRANVGRRVSFDSSATPDSTLVLSDIPAPAKKVDLAKLSAAIQATVEKAEAKDPKKLRARIDDLEEELERVSLEGVRATIDAAKAVPVLTQREKAQLEKRTTWPHNHAPRSRPLPAPRGTGVGNIGGGMRRMMIALAQRPGLNSKQLGVRASMSSNSGTFGTYLAKMRTNGWLEGTGRDSMRLTPAGVTALGEYTPLPEGQALLDHWLTDLGSGPARMLQALANAYPRALTKEQLGTAANISHSSGTFGTYLSKLRTLELITGSKELQASAELFG
ncbi:MAG TPA: helicase HerA-like domain-containing protein [Chthoniobacteraceae bacterium]|jgi:hypothetical protein